MRKHEPAKQIEVIPKGLTSLGLWMGTDHYKLMSALRRAPFSFPAAGVHKISRIAFSEIPGFQEDRYLIEYHSGQKDCLVILNSLPAALKENRLEKLSPFGAALRYLDLFRREPSSMLLPLALPLGITLVMTLFGLWSDLFLRNSDVLNFFAPPLAEPAVRPVKPKAQQIQTPRLAQLSAPGPKPTTLRSSQFKSVKYNINVSLYPWLR